MPIYIDMLNKKLFITVLFVPAILSAQTTIFDFMNIDPSGRGGAMAGALVSMTDDPNLIFYNPACLGTITENALSLSYMKDILDINAGFASYAQQIQGFGAVGVGVQYLDYGSFPRTDQNANVLGSFGASDVAFSLGYSNMLDSNLYYGANAKMIFSGIDTYHSTAVALDAGLLYVIPDKKMSFGISIQNAGTQLTEYIATREPLPFDVRVGGTVQPKGLPLVLNLDFNHLTDEVTDFGDHFRAFEVGGEFLASKALRLRFGYDNEKRLDMNFNGSSGLAGISLGLGIIVKNWRVDYGFSSWGAVGSLHRITVSSLLNPSESM